MNAQLDDISAAVLTVVLGVAAPAIFVAILFAQLWGA